MTPLPEQALRAVLLPVLVAQALQVRRKALRLPEASGPRDGVAGDGPVLRLLIAGLAILGLAGPILNAPPPPQASGPGASASCPSPSCPAPMTSGASVP